MSQTDDAAVRADDFVQSIGVNTHLSEWYTSYGSAPSQTGDPQKVLPELSYLGISQVRDQLPTYDPANLWNSSLATYEAVAQAGYHFDILTYGSVDVSSQISIIDLLAQSAPGAVTSVEGPNEVQIFPFTYHGLSGTAATNAFQHDLYAAVHSDPVLNGVPVIGYTVGSNDAADIAAYGDQSADADYGNDHGYTGFLAPINSLASQLAGAQVITPGEQMFMTETGLYTDPTAGVWGSVSEDVQAKYTLDLLFDDKKAGVVTTYLYELLDDADNSSGTYNFEDHFGLFNADGTPKEVAVALHNLTSILGDDAPTNRNFQTSPLNFSVTELPSSGNTLLLEKSDGTYDIVVWAEPEIWNLGTLSEAISPTIPVTVNLGGTYQTVDVYDPLSGTTAIQSDSNVSAVTLGVTDHPLIIEVSPNSTAGVGVTASGGQSTTTDGSTTTTTTTTGTGSPASGGPTSPPTETGPASVTVGGTTSVPGSTTVTASGGATTGTAIVATSATTAPSSVVASTTGASATSATAGSVTTTVSGPTQAVPATTGAGATSATAGSVATTVSGPTQAVPATTGAGATSATAGSVATTVSGPTQAVPATTGAGATSAIAGSVATTVPGPTQAVPAIVPIDITSAATSATVAAKIASPAVATLLADPPAGGSVYSDPASAGGQADLLYVSLLQRAPDAAGLGHFVSELQGGETTAQIAAEMIASPEYQAGYGALDNTAFVTSLYSTLLERAPDASGLAHWANLLDTGVFDRATLAATFVTSAEVDQVQSASGATGGLASGVFAADPADVEVLGAYETVFGRLPDRAGLNYWAQAVHGGLSEQDLLRSFMASAEFQSGPGAGSDTAFVQRIQVNTQGGVDASGTAQWSAALGAGAVSRLDVADAYLHTQGLAVRLASAVTANGISLSG